VEITALYRYPVKSLAGSAADSLDIEPWGPAGDRRWAVVDEDGVRVTAREIPAMLAVSAHALPGGGVSMTAPDGSSLTVDPPVSGTRIAVTKFRNLTHAVDAGQTAAEFVSKIIGRPLRLVWQDDPRHRPVPDRLHPRVGDVVSLADAGPLLLCSQASLAQLQSWIGSSPVLSMRRFRPNVVIDGSEPFAEDGWNSVRLGSLEFRSLGPCDRCVMTTIDPDTLSKGPEPIKTLARYRRWDGKTWFGIWLVPVLPGVLSVGDSAVAS
jgi:uncharacterized protein